MSVVEICHVGKTIAGARVLEDVSMTLRPGKVTGVSGVNGSGKTMLMRIISGLVRPTEGEIRIDGETLGRDVSFPPSIGILIESPTFLDDRSGFDNLRLLAEIKGSANERQIKRCIAQVGLNPQDKRRFRKYSLGMKQRLGIAAAIMERPAILLLDEPTNALDASGVEMLKTIVRKERERGAATLLSCHDAAILRDLADEIWFMAEGHIDGHEALTGDAR